MAIWFLGHARGARNVPRERSQEARAAARASAVTS
jgi:hypothetical protein